MAEIKLGDTARFATRKTQLFLQTFTLDFAAEVIQETPVDTGFLRSSWYITTSATVTFDPASFDKSGNVALAKIAVDVAQLRQIKDYFLVNNTEYGPALEFGTQHIAPRAFVRGVGNRAQSIADGAALRVQRASI